MAVWQTQSTDRSFARLARLAAIDLARAQAPLADENALG
jgi:hypothetical protein